MESEMMNDRGKALREALEAYEEARMHNRETHAIGNEFAALRRAIHDLLDDCPSCRGEREVLAGTAPTAGLKPCPDCTNLEDGDASKVHDGVVMKDPQGFSVVEPAAGFQWPVGTQVKLTRTATPHETTNE